LEQFIILIASAATKEIKNSYSRYEMWLCGHVKSKNIRVISHRQQPQSGFV